MTLFERIFFMKYELIMRQSVLYIVFIFMMHISLCIIIIKFQNKNFKGKNFYSILKKR